MNLAIPSLIIFGTFFVVPIAHCEASALDVVQNASHLQDSVVQNTTVQADRDCSGTTLQSVPDTIYLPVAGGKDLIASYSWADLEGAQVSNNKLCVSPIDRSIIGMPIGSNDGVETADWLAGHAHSPDTANPPISFLGPHIETSGPFSLNANFIRKKNSGAFLNIYGRVPVIQDEKRREGEAIALGLVSGKAVVKIWDGKSETPKIYEFGHGLKSEVKMSLEKSNDFFILKVNGSVAGKIPDPGVFKSGMAFIGADVSKGNHMCLGDFSITAPSSQVGKTKVSKLNPFEEIPADPKALRSIAMKHGLNIGTCVSINALMSDPEYRTRLAQNFNMVTPENAMKFQFIHPGPNTYAFSDADAIVRFAMANHMKVHAHTLVWGESNPRWLTEGNYTNEQLRNIIHEHIKTVAGHFKGKVTEWDVLNEPLEDDGSLRQTIWAKALGADYPAIVFKWAHEADPKAKLFINEYGADGVTDGDGDINARAEGLAKLVTKIRAGGGHIDGVGLQMHDKTDDYSKRASIEANMRRFNAMGIEARISEMDVSMDNSSSANVQKQAEIYREGIQACMNNPKNCHTFSMWGFEDKWSSLQKNNNMYSPDEGLGLGMIFDQNGEARPAYRAIQEVLSK